MFLTSPNLIDYLIATGRVTAESVVNGDVSVTELHRRNRNFAVTQRISTGLFVKQIAEFDWKNIDTLRRETDWHRFIQADSDYSGIASLMPKFIHYDAQRHILIVELIREAETLTQHHQRLGTFPIAVGRSIGNRLAIYHHIGTRKFDTHVTYPFILRKRPFILSLTRDQDSNKKSLRQINPDLLDQLRKHSPLRQQLDNLYRQWTFECPIHGDIRGDNVLLVPTDNDLEVRFVDWELADFGDSAWDIAGIFQDYLVSWVSESRTEIRSLSEKTSGHMDDQLQLRLPALREFWSSYCEQRALEPRVGRHLLFRSTRYSGVRLIQSALEFSRGSATQTDVVRSMFQLGRDILSNVFKTTERLFST